MKKNKKNETEKMNKKVNDWFNILKILVIIFLVIIYLGIFSVLISYLVLSLSKDTSNINSVEKNFYLNLFN